MNDGYINWDILNGQQKGAWRWTERIEALKKFDYDSAGAEIDSMLRLRDEFIERANNGYLGRLIKHGKIDEDNLDIALTRMNEYIDTLESAADYTAPVMQEQRADPLEPRIVESTIEPELVAEPVPSRQRARPGFWRRPWTYGKIAASFAVAFGAAKVLGYTKTPEGFSKHPQSVAVRASADEERVRFVASGDKKTLAVPEPLRAEARMLFVARKEEVEIEPSIAMPEPTKRDHLEPKPVELASIGDIPVKIEPEPEASPGYASLPESRVVTEDLGEKELLMLESLEIESQASTERLYMQAPEEVMLASYQGSVEYTAFPKDELIMPEVVLPEEPPASIDTVAEIAMEQMMRAPGLDMLPEAYGEVYCSLAGPSSSSAHNTVIVMGALPKGIREGSLEEYLWELKNAHPDTRYGLGNFKNALLDFTVGAHQRVGDKVKPHGRTGLVKALTYDNVKSVATGAVGLADAVGFYTPKGKEKPTGFFSRIGYGFRTAGKAVFGDIIGGVLKNTFWNAPGAAVRTGNNILQGVVDIPESALRDIGAKNVANIAAAPFEVTGQFIEENAIGGYGASRVFFTVDSERLANLDPSGLPIADYLLHGTDGTTSYNPEELKNPEDVWNGGAAVNDNVNGKNIYRRAVETAASLANLCRTARSKCCPKKKKGGCVDPGRKTGKPVNP